MYISRVYTCICEGEGMDVDVGAGVTVSVDVVDMVCTSQVGTQSDIRDQRYRTEPDIGTSDIGLKCAESDIISDIEIKFSLISDIRHGYYHTLLAQW